MRSLKVLLEEIDDAKHEMLGLFQTAKNAGRDMTPAEAQRFEQLNQQVQQLRTERTQAEEQKRQIIMSSQSPNATSLSMRPERVLPTNGVLPSESSNRWNPDVHYRSGRLRAFVGPDAEQRAYHSGMFLRAFVSQHFGQPDPAAHEHVHRLGWSVTNAAGESSGPAGGYLVPAPLSNSVVEVMERIGVIRQVVPTTPMTSDTLSIPKRAGGLDVYYPGEGGLITDSDKDWAQIQLTARKRAVASIVSSELQDDALISIADNIAMEMGHALALKRDQECIAGDGTSTYGNVEGLLNKLGAGGVHDAAAGNDSWATLDLEDFTGLMGLLPDKYHAAGPAFLCSSAFYFNAMLRIHAAAGGNTIASLQGGDGGTRQFLGYPVYLTESLPSTSAASTVSCLFGSFGWGAVLGERLGIRLARSDDFRFLNDQLVLRATSRYDFVVHDGGDADNAGAYVGLKTAS